MSKRDVYHIYHYFYSIYNIEVNVIYLVHYHDKKIDDLIEDNDDNIDNINKDIIEVYYDLHVENFINLIVPFIKHHMVVNDYF